MNFCNNSNGMFSSPYPSVKGVRQDPRFARMLYGSYIDELQAISGYIYSTVMFDDDMNELAGIYEHIAETEMLHFRLLGELLKELGTNPSIRTQVRTTPIELIDKVGCRGPIEAEKSINSNMEDKRRAAEEYRRLVSYTSDPTVKAILERIAQDEEHHYNILKGYQL